jgi:hypothetical protein
MLVKIMAEILSILALSTKVMTERRMSEFIYDRCSFLVDDVSEQFLKRLMGKTDVEDALLRLDSLTKEESLMAMAKNLEVTHQVDRNVKEIKVLVEERRQWSISLFTHVHTNPIFYRIPKQEQMCFSVCYFLTVPSSIVKADTAPREPVASESSNMALSS